MKKRLICMALLVATMVLLAAPVALANEIWYVYTDNGKTLNVRERPNGPVIGELAYGAPVQVVYYDRSGWSLIWYRTDNMGFTREGEAYVNSRFLVRNPPAPHNSGKNSGSAAAQDGLAAINAQFRTAKKVDVPYTVVSRPSRATGWVNLRWAPNTDAERIATCPQGKILIVLVEMQDWYQVQDPETGMVGFISRKFTSLQ